MEKYSWLKPIALIVVLVVTIMFGAFYIIQTENQTSGPMTNTLPPVPPDGPPMIDETANWQTYVSEQGRYTIKYPANYTINTNPANLPDAIRFVSSILPGTNTNFTLSIRYKNVLSGQKLQQLIAQNPVCDSISSSESTSSVINGESPAEMYVDTPCGQNVLTAVYTLHNNILYIFTVESQANFSEIKPYLDKLISTLTFVDETSIVPTTPATINDDMTFCTQDAMMCRDGSWVGRTGPNCEFVCPAGI